MTHLGIFEGSPKFEMEVAHDESLYRHLKFTDPDRRSCLWFDIITWPGSLVINGDMGTYSFSRIKDMFEFFHEPLGKRKINPGYWAEKCTAEDTHCRIKTYSPERAREVVLAWIGEESDPYGGLAEAVETEVLSYVDEGEVTFRDAVDNFSYEEFQFADFWEKSLTEYSYQYLWCCHAIVYGINEYRKWEAKEDRPA